MVIVHRRTVWGVGLTVVLIGLIGAGPTAAQGSTPVADPGPPAVAADWPTYHRDPARSGYVPDLPDPHQLTRAWSTELDGAVYAEPLVVGDRVLVATEGDSLYALDAATGQVQWQTTVGSPVPLRALPCGNINPLGITGTPVYDPVTGGGRPAGLPTARRTGAVAGHGLRRLRRTLRGLRGLPGNRGRCAHRRAR